MNETCSNCGRPRTSEDKSYSPMQFILGETLGWYSEEGTEFCGECMTNLIKKQ